MINKTDKKEENETQNAEGKKQAQSELTYESGNNEKKENRIEGDTSTDGGGGVIKPGPSWEKNPKKVKK